MPNADVIDPALLNKLTQTMDELAQRAKDVLARYLDHSHQLQGGGLIGNAGDTNIVTAGEIHDAQRRIQEHFTNVTEALRGNITRYVGGDHDGAHGIAGVAGGLRYT